MRSHRKPLCPKCRADIGKPNLWRSFPKKILHLKKALRLEKIKFNFLKKRIKRLEKKNGMTDQVYSGDSE